MATLKYKVIKEGMIDDKIIPINIVFVDKKDIEQAGVSDDDAIKAIGKQFDGPTGINIFDMDAITTTSDGLVVEGAIVKMGAADSGRVNPDFGILPMAEIEYSEDIEEDLSHLKIPEFLKEIEKVASESYRVLKKDKFCAILMGDTRIKGHIQPLGFEVMKVFEKVGFKLKEIILKNNIIVNQQVIRKLIV